MRNQCPAVQLRDIWRALQKLQARGLVYCLTPNEITGRLYFLTERGREFTMRKYGVLVHSLPHGIDWTHYAYIARGQARKTILVCLKKPWRGQNDKTIAAVRKLSLQVHPLCMAAAIRAMQELEATGLVRRVGVTELRQRPLYRLTTAGQRIIAQMGNQPVNPNALSSSIIKSDDSDTS